MIIRINGGKSGISKYLIDGTRDGRSLHRDEIDQRQILSGSITDLDNILNSFDKECKHQKYLHITLSFKEQNISQDILESINNDFRQFIMTATVEDEFYYYSETHLPKIHKALDKQGKEYERLPHIHVVIPQYNLFTATRDNPLSRVESINEYIDAFQEICNDKYGLESPKDNLRKLSVGKAEIINRYEISPDMSRQEIKKQIFDIVSKNRQISSVDELAKVLSAFGEVKIRESQKFGDRYINLAFDASGKRKAINLKDKVFLDDYLKNRSTAESKNFRNVTKYQRLFDDWKEYKAIEARFVEKSSNKERKIYHSLTHEQQRKWLNERWGLHINKITEISNKYKPEIKPLERVKVPFLLNGKRQEISDIQSIEVINSIEEIKSIDELSTFNQLGEINERSERERNTKFRNETSESEHTLSDLQIRGSATNSSKGKLSIDANILQTNVRNDVERDNSADNQDVFVVRNGRRITPLEQHQEEVKQRFDSATWTEKINAIDCKALLDYASYHYKVDAKQLKISRSKKGYERIIFDGRSYSAADYLTKVVNLTWTDAKPVLNEILQSQNKRQYSDKAISSSMLWHNFNKWEQAQPTLNELRKQYNKRKSEIYERLKYQYDPAFTNAQNSTKRRLLHQQRLAELEKLDNSHQSKIATYKRPTHERYLDWLYGEVKSGSKAALTELNRVYPYRDNDEDDKEQDAFVIQIKDKTRPLTAFAPISLGYEIKIKQNGTIDYIKDEKKVMTDSYFAVKVYDKTTDTIIQALEMAKARFGKDAYEIRNASKLDIAKIQEAVNKTGIRVKIIQDDKQR